MKERLWFGVESKTPANDLLQNNLAEFEWATRNKIYPAFWGRNINGENSLTKEEISFLHGKACKIALLYASDGPMETEEQGKAQAETAAAIAMELGAFNGKAIFLQIDQAEVTSDFLKGFAQELIAGDYLPGFQANTDAAYSFDREYSRGLQTDNELFRQCLVWAVSPTLKEYDQMTTTHLIHPDNWKPFAPSGITRKNVALWRYGKDCHPIQDDEGNETSFHVDLVRNKTIMMEAMF